MTISLRTPRLLLCAGLLAGALLAGARSRGDAPGADRILLRFKYAQGQSLRYRMVSDVTVPVPVAKGAALQTYTLDTTSVIRQTVQKLLDSGGAQVLTRVEQQQMRVDGRPQDPIPTPDTVTSFDSLGRVIHLKGDQPGGLGKLFSSASSFGQFLPDQAVEPGDSWTYPFHLEGVSDGGAIKTSFVRYAQLGPYKIVRLHSLVTMPIKADAGVISGAAEATGTLLVGAGSFQVDTDVAPREGFVVRNTASGTLSLHATPRAGAIKSTDSYARGISINVKVNTSMALIS